MFKKIWNNVRPTTRRGYIGYALLFVFILVGYQMWHRGIAQETAVTPSIPQVHVQAASSYTSGSKVEAVGTISAVSEVTLKAETGGQVTAVYTDLGKYVAAGAVLAEFSNARERAALTQAQGAYDAAVAGAAQSDSGTKSTELAVTAAETAYVTALKGSYPTVTGVLWGTIDQFFGDPKASLPGLRVSGDAALMNSTRIMLQQKLPLLEASVKSISPATANDVQADTSLVIDSMLTMIDNVLQGINRNPDDVLNDRKMTTYRAELIEAKSRLTALQGGLITARQGVTAAKEALNRATLAGSGSGVSLSDAQIKIALGSLRAAQAAYEKTLVRTPISGVVNSFSIKRGDYIAPMQDVALVANNKGLQVETAITERDRAYVTLGDSVSLDGVATGTVVAIGGAVDPATGKIGVKIAVTASGALTNGTTVTVTFDSKTNTTADAVLSIPLKAVKLTADGALVFGVNDSSTLEAHEVKLGSVLGDSVVITDGLQGTDRIISDARGRKAGEKVEVIK